MAINYLAIQGSSVPCERLFSDAGLTNTKRRGRLLPENFGAIQTVKAQLKKRRCETEQLKLEKEHAQQQRWEDDSAAQVASQALTNQLYK